MVFGYVYETGRRAINQDALFLRASLLNGGELCVAAVCDGMGGEECGERASFECVEALDRFYDKEIVPIFTKKVRRESERIKILKSIMISFFYNMNQQLFLHMRKKEGCMGSTMSILILYKKQYYIFHIGDSRIYFAYHIFGKTIFKCKTKDHAVDKKLTKCLGLNKDYKPYITYGKLRCRNFLLCTDGLHNLYNKKVWEECFSVSNMGDETKIKKRLKELAMSNFKNGESDNASALWIKKEV